jgi:hypothetical protein
MLEKNSISGSADEVCKVEPEFFVIGCEMDCLCCSGCCEDDDETCNADKILESFEGSWESGYQRDGDT